MKRVINLLKNHLDWLDDHKHSKLAKNMNNANSEIKAFEKAIKILENSERETSTEISEQTETKALHIADVMARFSISKAIKFELKNGKYIDANGNEISTELLMKYKHEIYHDNGILWLD